MTARAPVLPAGRPVAVQELTRRTDAHLPPVPLTVGFHGLPCRSLTDAPRPCRFGRYPCATDAGLPERCRPAHAPSGVP